MAATLKLGNANWAAKEGSLLAYNDENDNFKPLPFDFTRASSATYVASDGLIKTSTSGQPRIDFLNNTNGTLLLEPQRTNLITYSEDFSNSYWQKSGATVTSGFTSPDGTANAFKLVEDTSNNLHIINRIITVSNATNYSTSIFAKLGERTKFGIRDGFSNKFITINLSNGSVIDSNGLISSKITQLENDWYKISLTFQTAATSLTLKAYILGDSYTSGNPDDVSNRYQGNGSSGLYIYGAQLEEASYPTSYIPTSGSTVTRVAETCSQTPASGVIGQTAGTIYWEIDVETLVATANENILNIDAGFFGNTIYFIKTATGSITAEIYVSGGVQASFTKTNITKGVHKIALGYANNNTACFIDGVQVGVNDTSCTIPATNRVQLGSGAIGASDGKIKSLQLYNTRLSNSELATLTTI